MAECQINKETIRKGIETQIDKILVSSDQFNVQNGIYVAKSENFGAHQFVVDNINFSFQEEIVMSTNDLVPTYTIVEPSDKLINKYLASAPKNKTIQDEVFVDIQSVDGEDFKNPIYRNGVQVGQISMFNDGTYLNVQQVDISEEKQGIGTAAYKQIGSWALEAGLQLRSDIVDVRMNDGSRALWNKLVKQGLAQFDGSRYTYTGLPDNIFMSATAPNAVNYTLTSINILQSPRADEIFRKGDKNSWSVEKMLSELNISKHQQEIILGFNTRNREEILANLLANYSYTIEINKSVENEVKRFSGYERDGRYFIPDFDTGGEPTEITKEQYEENSKVLPTQHYSNLTVPGGTNYTENEIATPAITPSIKGHAQFATDKGIGWFRSDDKGRSVPTGPRQDDGAGGLVQPTLHIAETPKTRRILEVQSDLFQKGRGKEDLISPEIISSSTNLELGTNFSIGEIAYENALSADGDRLEYAKYVPVDGDMENLDYILISKEEYEQAYKVAQKRETLNKRPINAPENQFLQLLNKDNNWVTFFIKSIIQDSAKKGYEKVLFPKGDTAAKIEGHQTIEQFIKIKQDRLDEINKGHEFTVKNEVGTSQYRIYDETGRSHSEGLTEEEAKRRLPDVKEQSKYWNSAEKTQLEKEIEDVKAGTLKISAIAKFYEETVFNVLKKQGFNPQVITDEYGNGWYEISDFAEETISLSATPLPTQTLSKDQQLKFERLQDAGLISKDFNVHNGRVFYKIPNSNEDKKARLEECMRSREIDFLRIIDGPDGYLVQLGILDTIDNNYNAGTRSSKAGQVTKARVLRFLDNIGFRNVQTVNQLIYRGQKLNGTAYVDFMNGVMQIVEGQEDYALPEESMHILVELMEESNNPLFQQLMKEVVNYKLYTELLKDPAYIGNKFYLDDNGNLDYTKIKKEAVAKLLAEFLINKLEGTNESAKRIETAHSLWQQILQWIREKFGQYKNPFKQALQALEESDTSFGEFADVSSEDVFFSAKSLQQIDQENQENREIFDRIKNRPSELNITKVVTDDENAYYRDGVQVPKGRRITDLVDAYYTRLFGNRNFDESLKEFYEQSRRDGDYLHEIAEEIINSNIDTQTGLMKRNADPLTFPLQGNPIQGKMVTDLKAYIKKMMAGYPTGTRFITEQVVYDATNDRYGTIDFAAIKPDGTIDILDWKSMLMQDLEGAKDYKREGIFIQLNEYKRILKDEYGVEKFGKIRAIPIKKNYVTDKLTKERKLKSIDIGDADAAKITQINRSLRPIISPEESTGSEVRDEIVSKLESLYKSYIDKGYFKDERSIISNEQEASYEIRVTNSVDHLANYFVDLLTKFRQVMAEGKSIVEAGNKDDISEALSMIKFYEDILDNVVQPSAYLQEDTSIDKPSRTRLFENASKLQFLAKNLKDLRSQMLDKLAQKEGIFNLLKPEKVVNMARRWFRSMGSQDIASVRYMYELVKKSYGRIDIETDNELKVLKDLKFEFDQWQKASGLSKKDAIAKLVNYEKGKIHSKIDKSFYEARQIALESKKAKDILEFVKTNYDLEEYKNWYNQQLEELKERHANTTYDPTDKAKDTQIKKRQINLFEVNYNIFTNPVTAFGYHNQRVWSKNIKEELWLSPEYQELVKPENKALLDMYDFMVRKNKQLADTGAIEDFEAYTFLPNVRKSWGDILDIDDTSALAKIKDAAVQQYKDWRSSISVDDYQLNYQGARDPFTGEKLEKRFVPFVSPIEPNEKSFDLFTVYGLMTKEVSKEKYLQENDEILRALVHVEKSKPVLEQNKFGTVSMRPDGKPKVSDEKGKNAPILEEHVRAIVNGESIQYDADYVVRFKLREKWNKSKLGKLYQFDTNSEDYNPTSVSATKFLMWLNTANTKRVLGVNAASAISNLFGGTYSSNKLYQKYVSEKDLHASWFKMTSGGFYASEPMKKNAALVDYFLPLLNNRESFKSSQLSVNQASQILSQDWLMMPMRKTSELVQLNIFLAVIENTGIVDGKLVNLRQKAMSDLNYEGRYELSESDRKALEKKFQDTVQQYKEQYGLEKTAQFKTIKEGGKDKVIIDLPGISRDSEDVQKLREITQTIAKDSLGEADEFDQANYKYSIWWRLFMTFKNWIPRMVDVRFGEFRPSQAHHSYEYGRFRMFAKALSANYVETALKLVPLPYLTNRLTNAIFSKEAIIQRAKETYAEKLKQEKLLGRYNPETFISQGEFIDRFIQGSEATFAELRTLMLMMGLLFLGLAAPDDDDDQEEKAWKSLARRQANKLIDEVGFFYSPKSFIDIAGGGFPVYSLVRDGWALGTDVTQQFFGFTFEQIGMTEKGVEWQEEAKPVKRSFKMFPVLKEILTYLPAVDKETAKDWGVRITDRRAF